MTEKVKELNDTLTSVENDLLRRRNAVLQQKMQEKIQKKPDPKPVPAAKK